MSEAEYTKEDNEVKGISNIEGNYSYYKLVPKFSSNQATNSNTPKNNLGKNQILVDIDRFPIGIKPYLVGLSAENSAGGDTNSLNNIINQADFNRIWSYSPEGWPFFSGEQDYCPDDIENCIPKSEPRVAYSFSLKFFGADPAPYTIRSKIPGFSLLANIL